MLEESKKADEELANEEGVIYRDGDPEAHEREIARWRYEERVKSGWYQTKKERNIFLSFFVALEGFEPSQAEPESDVLPLHHKAILRCPFTGDKGRYYFCIYKFFADIFNCIGPNF